MSVWVIVILPTAQYERILKQDAQYVENFKNKVKGTKIESCMNTIDEETPLPEILEKSFEELLITNAVWIETKNEKFYQVYFDCDVEESDAIIQFLYGKGFGLQPETFIGMIPLSLHYRSNIAFCDTEIDGNEEKPSCKPKAEVTKKVSGFRSMQEKFLKSVTARLTVAQVVSSVKAGADLTFDFVCYVVFAAWIAAMGLLDNSVVNTVASMLVSPLMGPVMAMTFGTIIRDKKLRNMGIRNACIGFGISVLFGYIFGLVILNLTNDWNKEAIWPTGEMQARGQLRVLWVGMLVAIPSGAAVAVSLLSGNQSSLVGVAISASLLPPCVNAGLLWSFATLKVLRSIDAPSISANYNNKDTEAINTALISEDVYKVNYFENMAAECAVLGIVSIMLAVVNVICIFVMAFIVLKVKEVAPLSSMSSSTSRFWKEDVKIARERNATFSYSEGNVMGKEILKEWAEMTGMDSDQLLANNPEAHMTQVQTLRDLLEEAADDDVFRSIVKSTQMSKNDFLRKVNQSPTHRRKSTTPAYLNVWDAQPISNRRNTIVHIPSSPVPNIIPASPRRPSAFPGLYTSSAEHLENDSSKLDARRQSNALLRHSLQTSDHLPYSVWPQHRQNRFTVTPVSDAAAIRTRRASRIPRLSSESVL